MTAPDAIFPPLRRVFLCYARVDGETLAAKLRERLASEAPGISLATPVPSPTRR